MTKWKEIGKDVLKSVLIGLVIGLAFTAVLTIIGMIISKVEFYGTINVVRTGLILVGALGMLVVFVLLLMRRKSEELDGNPKWKKHFSQLTVKTVIMYVSVVFVLLASLADALLYL